jgi:recombination protein RecA
MIDGKASMGNRAKALYKMLRIRNEMLYKLGVTQIYINQLRTKLNAGFAGEPYTTPGGLAMEFFSSIRLALFGGKTLTVKSGGKERKVGRYVTARVMKNKVSPPRATISKAPMYFMDKYGNDIGFYRYFGLLDVLMEEELITREGFQFMYKGQKLCKSEEKFSELIATDEKLRKELLEAAGINTIAKTKKQLKSIKENLFPINETIQDSSDEEEAENND